MDGPHKNIKVLQINPKPIYENNMRGLQIAVDQKIQELNKTCKRCDNENLITNFITGLLYRPRVSAME